MWISNILNIFLDSDIVVIENVLKLFNFMWSSVVWLNFDSDAVLRVNVLKLFNDQKVEVIQITYYVCSIFN